MFKDLWATFGRWRLWYVQANQDIQMRYRRSVIGPFWISLSLAAVIFGLAVLYGQLFRVPFTEYVSYLAPGLLCWFFLQSLISEGCGAIIENDGNMRAVPIPISITAARVTYRNVIVFLHNLIVVLAMLAIFGQGLGVVSLLAFGGVALYILFGYFTAIALGPICARFRDIPQVIGNLLQMAFFLSPVMWRPEQLPAEAQIFAFANPIYHLIEVVRQPLLGAAPDEVSWIFALSTLAVVFVLAMISVGVSRKRVYLWL